MPTISFQSELRPELPVVDGPKEYREQRALLGTYLFNNRRLARHLNLS
jgi:hypothetical protein